MLFVFICIVEAVRICFLSLFPGIFLIVSRSVSNFVRVESEDQDFHVKPFFMTVSSGSFTCPPIYSLIKYVFTIYYVPGTALGTEMT